MNFTQRIIGLALLGNLGACDESIGRDACVGAHTECQDIHFDFYQPLDLTSPSIERLSAVSSGALSVRWRLDPCAGVPCYPLAAPGPDQSVWVLFAKDRTPSVPRTALEVRRYDADGELLSTVEIDQPDFPSLGGHTPPTSDADGRLFTNVHWFAADDDDHRAEVLRVDTEGRVTHTEVPWTSFRSNIFNYGVVPGVDGFDVFESVSFTHVLRAYHGQGELSWQQTELLGDPGALVVDVVRTENGYALTGSSFFVGDSTPPTLLFTDQFGNALHGFRFDGRNEPKLRAVAHDQIAVAVTARQHPEQDPEAGDIVVFRLDPSGDLSGFQLQRRDYQQLTLHAFTCDSDGNLFLSTKMGARDAPVGLLCRAKVDGDARCFESELDLTFGSLVALDEGTLYALTNETHELMRVELPD